MFARLLLLFILIPLVEFWLFIRVGQSIGLAGTLLSIVFTGFLGAYLTKKQGSSTLRQLKETLQQGQIPPRTVLSGVLILGAGAVLLTPGFLTDALGFSLLIPFVRERMVTFLLTRFSLKMSSRVAPFSPAEAGPQEEGNSLRPTKGRVIE